ncbi:MAG: tRNA (adenosine(37)-N6)-threonylcarbamoyltransferase complex dimerization subunit type 1 TsaB [Chloroflexi bacterium]|nr:MAG: tRNA (adenosine(37)-N6)-threonylcarbamoyltransferase complex dimerization subunit type 1 TsaB [Chloroflexota bacterium]
MLLAIDTATHTMSIALHDGTQLLAEQSWQAGKRQTTELAPAIQRMMALCKATMADLTAVAVSIGPGSYSGVRVGVAFAKGVADAHHLPLVGITTLDTLAYGQPYFQSGVGLITIVEAGRGKIIVQAYRWRKGMWHSRSEPRLMTWQMLLDTIDGEAYVTGDISQDALELLAKHDNVMIAPGAHWLRRAGYLAECALEKLRAAGDDQSAFAPANILPIYIQGDIS